MSKYNNRYEYMTENMVDWLKSFADKEAQKLAQQNGIEPVELKNAGYMENILDIVNRKKKVSVEQKVQAYREAVGLDLVDSLEKEGGQEKAKMASRITLSSRHKIAQDEQQAMNNIKQYVSQVIKNRNGAIATPALLEQLEDYMKLTKDWLRTNYEAIEKIIDEARAEYQPQDYTELKINDLARTDEPMKGDNQTQFAAPAKSSES